MVYHLKFSKLFQRTLKVFLKSGRIDKEKMTMILQIIEEDPFDPRLKTHRVNLSNWGAVWSSRYDGDIRIIWDFDYNNQLIIEILQMGGHSGKYNVYKK